MEDQLISLETAKLAKEKGFNIPVKNVFTRDYTNEEIYEQEGNLNNWNKNERDYSRSTQSLLQKWLREKHNIHIEIYYNEKKYCVIVFGKSFVKDKGFLYNTYEESLEEGLYLALKLITD